MAGSKLWMVSTGKKNVVLKKPARLTKYKTVYRSKMNKYKKKGRTTMNIHTLPGIVRTKFNTKAVFQGNFDLSTSTSGTTTQALFRLNSIWDADYGNITKNKTVNGWNLLNAQYGIYVVKGCMVNLKCYAGDGSLNPTIVTISAADTLTAWTTTDYATDIACRPGAKKVVLSTSSGNRSSLVLKKYYSIADIYGVNRQKVSDDGAFGAYMNTNPNNLAFLSINIATLPEVGTPPIQKVFFEIDLTFYVHLQDNNETACDN